MYVKKEPTPHVRVLNNIMVLQSVITNNTEFFIKGKGVLPVLAKCSGICEYVEHDGYQHAWCIRFRYRRSHSSQRGSCSDISCPKSVHFLRAITEQIDDIQEHWT